MNYNNITSTEFKNIIMVLVMVLTNITIISILVFINAGLLFLFLFVAASCILCYLISLRNIRRWVSDPVKAMIGETEHTAEINKLILDKLQQITKKWGRSNQTVSFFEEAVIQDLETIKKYLEDLTAERNSLAEVLEEKTSEAVNLSKTVEVLKDQENVLQSQFNGKNQEIETLKVNSENLESDLNELADNITDQKEAVLDGKLFYRVENKLEGRSGEIVEGINEIMDAYINLLDNINSTTVLIVDKDYNIQFSNQYALRFAVNKTNVKDAIGAKCYDIFGCNMTECMAAECLAKDEKYSFVENGSGLDIAVDMIPYKDKNGSVRGIIELSKDVTDIKNTERKVQKQLDYQKAEVEKLVQNLNLLEKGELEIEIMDSKGDEDTRQIADIFNQLNQSLMKSTKAIKMYIDEISNVISDIAGKNLSGSIEREYLGDFDSLKDSINNIIDQYNIILSDFNSASSLVKIGAHQVSSSSQSLSKGASEQATAVEEIVATINDVAEQTKHNAMYANKASELSEMSKEDAQNGNHQMREMLIAMNEIKESSNNIASVIKVIDDIAFQTNILALNAAVEAARAGHYGKGFAVVAEEVRNLASRSSAAAKETTDLIDNSLKKVEAGNRIVNETASALNKIVVDVSEIAEIVDKIAEASTQQASAIEQINSGINQISKVTQANTATAEASAAASEEMEGQAEMLKSQIDEFQLRDIKMSLPLLQRNDGRY